MSIAALFLDLEHQAPPHGPQIMPQVTLLDHTCSRPAGFNLLCKLLWISGIGVKATVHMSWDRAVNETVLRDV
jgi:hypothetical protein